MSVTRGWAGGDNTTSPEPASSHTNCLKTGHVPTRRAARPDERSEYGVHVGDPAQRGYVGRLCVMKLIMVSQ